MSLRTAVPAAIVLACLACLGAGAAPAGAAWFPGEALDGPSADVLSVEGVDVSRDGAGGLLYRKRENGVAHLYLARLVDGAWRPAERVDVGLEGSVSAATIAVGDGQRLAIAFVSDGGLYGTFVAGGAPTGPLSPPQGLAEGTIASPVTAPQADMGINGTAYVTYARAGDVGAVRLEDAAWAALPFPLDVDPAATAGAGLGRPKVAVSAEGYAVATWGEAAAGGSSRVLARRLTGLTPSISPQVVSLPDLGGVPGGAADSPDLDIEDDGSFAWVTWRQDFDGVSRAVSRRLVGSSFEAPTAVDGGNAARAPRISMNGRGVGQTVAEGDSGSVVGDFLDKTDAFLAPFRVDGLGGAGPASPSVAVSERRQVGVAWRRDPGAGADATIQARYKPDAKPLEAETTLSVAGFGPVVGGPIASSSKNGDIAVGFVQGAPDARRVVAAVFDDLASKPVGRSTSQYQRRSKPRLVWTAGSELWGALQFKVYVDRVEIGTTSETKLLVPTKLAAGPHTWRADAIDRRGQVTRGEERRLRVDPDRPRVRVRVTGVRKRGRTLKVAVTALDGRGSGVDSVLIDPGNGGAPTKARRASLRYGKSGSYTLRVRVADRARNVTRATVRLRIRR